MFRITAKKISKLRMKYLFKREHEIRKQANNFVKDIIKKIIKDRLYEDGNYIRIHTKKFNDQQFKELVTTILEKRKFNIVFYTNAPDDISVKIFW